MHLIADLLHHPSAIDIFLYLFVTILIGYIGIVAVVFSILYMIGLPIATFYWTDHNIWWGLLAFFACSTVFTISTIWLVLKFFRNIKDEILTLSKTLSK